MKNRALSPYIAGGLTGLLMVFIVAVSAKYFGTSTIYIRIVGMIEKFFIPEHVVQTEYFVEKIPKINWQWMFLIGIFLGSLILSLATKTFKFQKVPDMWNKRYGPDVKKRALVAFVGGFIMIYGARLAGGCPSGHGLAGVMQLAPSGLVSAICFFIGGIFTARFVYGEWGRR